MLIRDLTPIELSDRHETVADHINWNPETADFQVCSIEEIPWLGLTDSEEGVSHILGFSVDDKHDQPLYPPYGSADAAARVKTSPMSFNSDQLSRGVGELLVNDPAHLQPGSVSGRIAVRSVSLATRPNASIAPADYDKSDRALFVRHGALTLGSAALNLLTNTGGSEIAARLMEYRYRRAPLVRMPIPPIWRRQQEKQGLPIIDDPGEIMLVRGRRYYVDNMMTYAGSFDPHAR